MTGESLTLGELQLDDYAPEHAQRVSALLLKFLERQNSTENDNELGLVLRISMPAAAITSATDKVLQAHPELEQAWQEADRQWLSGMPEEDRLPYCGNETLYDQRRRTARTRTVLSSPFAAEYHGGQVRYHLENTDAQFRAVVQKNEELLGYLAVWSGPSTLYLDDHAQVDALVVDPDLSVEDQRLVVSKFEPVLYEARLP